MRMWLMAGSLVALLLASYLAGALVIASCSENAYPETARGDACEILGDANPAWWLAVFSPAAIFGACLLSSRLRRHAVSLAIACAVLAVAIWIPVYLAVWV